MNITKVQIHINSPDNNVKAHADIIIDGEFIVKGLAVRLDAEGYPFVTMPFRLKETNHDKVRMDIAHPITETCRKYIQDKVLDAYAEALEKLPQPFNEKAYGVCSAPPTIKNQGTT